VSDGEESVWKVDEICELTTAQRNAMEQPRAKTSEKRRGPRLGERLPAWSNALGFFSSELHGTASSLASMLALLIGLLAELVHPPLPAGPLSRFLSCSEVKLLDPSPFCTSALLPASFFTANNLVDLQQQQKKKKPMSNPRLLQQLNQGLFATTIRVWCREPESWRN
jgi:hypothetical protein